jgi:Tfp pilus assembly protein PilF
VYNAPVIEETHKNTEDQIMKRFLVTLFIVSLAAGCGGGKTDQQTQSQAPADSAQQIAKQNYLSAGLAELKAGKPIEAIRNFDQSIKENPRDPQGYLILGQAYMHMKEYNRAVDTLEAAIRMTPPQGEVFYILAMNYRFLGEIDLAKKSAAKSLALFRKEQDQENFKKAAAFLQVLSASGKEVASTDQKSVTTDQK